MCTSSGRFKCIEPHRTFSNYIHTERARSIDFFHTSSGWFAWTEPSPTTSLQGIQGVQGALVREVQAKTSSNLLELLSHRDSKVNRLLLHEVGLDRTFFNYSSSNVQGAKCTSWKRFKHSEPHRTFSNYLLTARARYVDFFHTSSGWIDWTEPSPTTSLQGIQGVQGALCTSSGRFKRIEPHRTFSNYIHTERARSRDFFHTSSGWFDWTEHSPTTSLQGLQGVQGALVREVQANRTSSNLLELLCHRASKVYRHEFRVVRLYHTFFDYTHILLSLCGCSSRRFDESHCA